MRFCGRRIPFFWDGPARWFRPPCAAGPGPSACGSSPVSVSWCWCDQLCSRAFRGCWPFAKYSEVGPLGFATGLLTNFSKTGSKRQFQSVNRSDAKYSRFSKKR